ncbi:unnamed protein product [Pleuronectes platessa]|uniref:Uncharacterized protein n=1 Tax=Pleuronectes platessa TaxID=8262 RepID=A0A9N7VU62_PLEPL|nr:unnamed protein product [Pleuronectes platessa]
MDQIEERLAEEIRKKVGRRPSAPFTKGPATQLRETPPTQLLLKKQQRFRRGRKLVCLLLCHITQHNTSVIAV